MPNKRKGKDCHGTYLEDGGVLDKIGRGVGSLVRDTGEGVQRGLTATLRGLGDAAHGLADGLDGIESEHAREICVVVTVRGVEAKIRTLANGDPDRVAGSINQLSCPEERAARCGRSCMRTLGGNSGFPTDRFGSAYGLSKADDTM